MCGLDIEKEVLSRTRFRTDGDDACILINITVTGFVRNRNRDRCR